MQTASASSTHDEWVEIYNPASASVSLAGWYMQKHASSTGTSTSTFAPKDLFASSTIGPFGYFIIAHPSATIPFNASTSYGIGPNNALILKNPDGDIVDMVGWGSSLLCEGTCAPNGSSGTTLARNYASDTFAYIDTDNNAADFLLSPFPTPGGLNIFSATSTGSASSPPAASSTPTSTPPFDNSTSTASSTSSGPAATSTDPFATSTTPLASSTPPAATSTPTTIPSSTTNSVSHVVIFEIQTTGGPGNTENDYIKLFNPASSSAAVSGWKIRKRTSSGAESSVKVFPDTSALTPGGYFIWANSADNFADTMGANVSSTATIADNTSIALEDGSGAIIDELAWGSGLANPFVEGSPFPQNPGVGQKLRRKTDSATGLVQDADDNAQDFEM